MKIRLLLTLLSATNLANPRREPLKRVQSERRFRPEDLLSFDRSIPVSTESNVPDVCPTPPGPPDITAWDLSQEELKRTYSHDSVWDTKSQPLPPLPRMVGLGAYRRAADAPLGWQVEQLRRRNYGMPPAVAEQLSSLSMGPSEEAISTYRKNSLRSDSFASSKTSLSDLSDGQIRYSPYRERVDPKTGTRFTYGFGPSTPSSAASSFKASHLRKTSAQSSLSTGSDAEQKLVQLIRAPSLVFPKAPELAGLLTTIPEVKAKKTEKPCAFGDSGDNDEAFVSDDSEDEDWQDVTPSTDDKQESGLISQQLKKVRCESPKQVITQVDEAGQAPRHALDRSKTVKTALRPCTRRPATRNIKAQTTAKPVLTHALGRKPTIKRAMTGVKEYGDKPEESQNLDHPRDWLQNVQRSKAATEQLEEDPRNKENHPKESQPTNDECTLLADDGCAELEPKGLSIRNRRTRSRTVIQIRPGNVRGVE